MLQFMAFMINSIKKRKSYINCYIEKSWNLKWKYFCLIRGTTQTLQIAQTSYLKQIKQIVEFDPQAETHINNALQKRNYLIHDFYKKHNFAIHSDNGREQMLKDLDEIFKLLEIGHTQLSTITDLLTKLDKRNNLSEAEIKKLIDEGNPIGI